MSADIYVTADVHLRGEENELAWLGFRSLCRRARSEAAPLYVIGDLFDFWVGPKQVRLGGFRRVLDLLVETAERAPVHITVGNRDFAMGSEVGALPNITLHHDDIAVDWAGGRALLTHGDLLLENDRAYQRMRSVLRTRLVRGALRALPLQLSLRMAGALRSKSVSAVAKKPTSAFEISFARVRQLFRAGNYAAIVAGHVHRPGVFGGELSGRPRRFLTLGAWGARGWVVRLTADGDARLERFPGGGGAPPRRPLF